MSNVIDFNSYCNDPQKYKSELSPVQIQNWDVICKNLKEAKNSIIIPPNSPFTNNSTLNTLLRKLDEFVATIIAIKGLTFILSKVKLTEFLQSIINNTGKLFAEGYQFIKNVVSDILGNFSEDVVELLTTINIFFSATFSVITDAVTRILTTSLEVVGYGAIILQFLGDIIDAIDDCDTNLDVDKYSMGYMSDQMNQAFRTQLVNQGKYINSDGVEVYFPPSFPVEFDISRYFSVLNTDEYKTKQISYYTIYLAGLEYNSLGNAIISWDELSKNNQPLKPSDFDTNFISSNLFMSNDNTEVANWMTGFDNGWLLIIFVIFIFFICVSVLIMYREN